jgi:Zn-finger nucleic acid-binding protein
MKCPHCQIHLQITDRNGIEIDYCPECRGVWLDRGELDKIIERSGQYTQSTYTSKPYSESHSDHARQEEKYHYSDKHHHHKKKKGFLDDLFDF